MSRPFICRLLQKAKDSGIVEVYIKDESVHTVELEQQLKDKYKLKDIVVVSTEGLAPETVRRAVGQAGAYYLSKKILGT
ncbi:hypothetical protein GCM10020331_013180 [Ectobacillus funiculus]